MAPLLQGFDDSYLRMHEKSSDLVRITPAERLFAKPRDLGKTFTMFSVGEYILRSAGAVEQTFGGITTKLWDDPFEWTLPEELSTPDKILAYLDEAEETRRRGFSFFASDADLERRIAAPGGLTTIFSLLLDTLRRAAHFQGRAFAVHQMLSDEKLPRI